MRRALAGCGCAGMLSAALTGRSSAEAGRGAAAAALRDASWALSVSPYCEAALVQRAELHQEAGRWEVRGPLG